MKFYYFPLILALPLQLNAQEADGSPSGPAIPQNKEVDVPAFKGVPQSREEKLTENLSKHQKGSSVLATDQDELSADVQDLIDEQTSEQVIQLLEEVEEIMGETIDRLDKTDTGGETIAAETEIIEKIFDAAKKRQQQSQQEGKGSPQGEGMMEMMEQMMGKSGDQPGKQPGQGEGKGGQGKKGDSDASNDKFGGKNAGDSESRTVPKAAGKAGTGLPPEFQKALDAYNK